MPPSVASQLLPNTSAQAIKELASKRVWLPVFRDVLHKQTRSSNCDFSRSTEYKRFFQIRSLIRFISSDLHLPSRFRVRHQIGPNRQWRASALTSEFEEATQSEQGTDRENQVLKWSGLNCVQRRSTNSEMLGAKNPLCNGLSDLGMPPPSQFR